MIDLQERTRDGYEDFATRIRIQTPRGTLLMRDRREERYRSAGCRTRLFRRSGTFKPPFEGHPVDD